MDTELKRRLDEKVLEVIRSGPDLQWIASGMSQEGSAQFALGMAAGRLYNSFYYQCRRIMRRDPTREEFDAFLDTLRLNRDRLTAACSTQLAGT